MKLDDLTLGQIKELQCLLNKPQIATECCDPLNGKIVMAILQRGWIFVGRYEKKGSHVTLHPAINYRYQASGKGFGHVAAEGPTKDCKIDKCATPVRYHELTEVASIECEEDAWKKLL